LKRFLIDEQQQLNKLDTLVRCHLRKELSAGVHVLFNYELKLLPAFVVIDLLADEKIEQFRLLPMLL
jgi:hypothetical protein